MGRMEASHAPAAQQAFRKEQRAKEARSIINKTLPQILASDTRARKGIANAELIVDPARSSNTCDTESSVGKVSKVLKKKQRIRDESDVGQHAQATESLASNADLRESHEYATPKIRIQVIDTLVAARQLHQTSKSRKNVAVLNMASPLRPGGGVLNGATSQEESLCLRTTLLTSLKEEWYRLPEIGGIWSPDILVFRSPGFGKDEGLGKAERFYLDVISSAMTRFPDVADNLGRPIEDAEESVEADKVYADVKDRDLAIEKMKAVLQILKSHGTERVVLGAWGCGAYGNPVGEIARAWKKALLGSTKPFKPFSQSNPSTHLKDIVFAIKDPVMAGKFAKFWGDGVQLDIPEPKRHQGLENDADERPLEELQEKIHTLELQIVQTKTPMMREGLETTLSVLRDRLAAFENTESVSSDEEHDLFDDS